VSVTVANAAPPPPPPPTGTLKVYITAPSSGATVSGTNWTTLWLGGASGASNVYTLSVAGQTVATQTTASTGPVSIPWSTASAPDGPQTLTASARDATGNTGATSIPITIANGPPPPPPPLAASFTSPADGATVSGTVTVGMAASGGTTPYTYTLTLDGAQVASGASASHAWDTTAVADGGHSLALTVTDGAGATATASRAVSVSNTAPPPPPPPPPPSGGTLKVFVTSPTGGSTVSGSVAVNVWVEGAAPGNRVYTLTANGATVGTATDSGVHVTFGWNTRIFPNGATTLTATVEDPAGASGSKSIAVTLAN
jgi:hypothetical protein